MKKLYAIVCLLCLAGFASAQTYLSEDFSAGQMPPAGWTISAYAAQWSCAASNEAGGVAPEGKFTYVNVDNETRLISPVIDLTGLTTVTLMFNHMYDWYANPAPKVGVATRTGTGPWTSVWEITPTGNVAAETKIITISNGDVGAGFQFCFYIDGNFYNLDYWFVDDILLMTPAGLDAALTSIVLPQYVETSAAVDLTGTIKNLGTTTITSYDVAYSVDGGPPVVASYTGLTLDLGETHNFTHTTAMMFPDPGSYLVTVNIQNVNGGTDENPGNDTLEGHVGVVPWIPAKKEFCEEATGTWCGWCVRGICFMDYMAETYPETWIGVGVHNGDPMVVDEWDNEIPNIIPNFPGYPSGTIDRVKMWDPEQFEQGYAEQMEAISPGSVQIVNFSWDPGTRLVSFDVESEFIIDIYNELRFAAVIIEDSCWGTASNWAPQNNYAGGGNGPMCGFENMPAVIPAADMHYDHVGRAILDGPYGTSGSLPLPITAGSVRSYHYEYTIPSGWVYETLHFVGLLMDQTAGVILNANDEVIWVGMSELNNDLRLRIFPNPAENRTHVEFTLDKAGVTSLKVYDLAGHCLLATAPAEYKAGKNNVALDVSSLSQGFYFVEVTVNGHSNTQKIVVNR
jgi:hypothetical protein